MEMVSGLHALNSTSPVNSLYAAQNFLLGSTLTLDCLSFHWWGAAAGQPANLTPLKTSDSISAFLGSADGNSSHLTIRCSDYRALCVYPSPPHSHLPLSCARLACFALPPLATQGHSRSPITSGGNYLTTNQLKIQDLDH